MTNYKLGDRGVTRDGRVAECINDEEGLTYPLSWKTGDGRWWTTRRTGQVTTSCIYKSDADIIRLADDAKAEPEPAAAEVTKDDTLSTVSTHARFESDKFFIGGFLFSARLSEGRVSLQIGNSNLSEAEAAAVLRTIETVMEQARRAKEVVAP